MIFLVAVKKKKVVHINKQKKGSRGIKELVLAAYFSEIWEKKALGENVKNDAIYLEEKIYNMFLRICIVK